MERQCPGPRLRANLGKPLKVPIAPSTNLFIKTIPGLCGNSIAVVSIKPRNLSGTRNLENTRVDVSDLNCARSCPDASIYSLWQNSSFPEIPFRASKTAIQFELPYFSFSIKVTYDRLIALNDLSNMVTIRLEWSDQSSR